MALHKGLHPKNKHKQGYDFEALIQKNRRLNAFLFQNKFKVRSIDFSDPKAVKELNRSLLRHHYGIHFWDFPDENLCPPIPGRVDYIHHLSDLLSPLNLQDVKVLDIGTGATCIYPLLGVKEYNWTMVASDIDRDSLLSAQRIIDKNNLNDVIELRYQNSKQQILKGILQTDDMFSVTMCNPPFYKSAAEAKGANARKSRNLGNNAVRNFAGNNNELWYEGGEKAFLHNYLYESSLFPKQSIWFTSLVSKKENVKSLETSAKKLGVKTFKIIPMHQGNKVTRIVAWQF
ncbi:23S rRNA (adenine(1618)-N(6))-methyltransferase RlmF [Pseudotenacibaculum sp. MALMAid0570]|uniref:23S rRNA (adenine(1618)-N(6))-methyltransferase RlmF n=1 Tax=Pseudotenacibaculum sp. MALMAid0570 TaxID=3143938 RepID=UPI0032DEC940